MNRFKTYFITAIFVVAILTGISSCEENMMEGDPNYSPRENFEYLWTQVDEKYSYFDQKDVDWDIVYTNYSAQVSDDMADEQFFNLMFEMLSLLQDGHVNLKSPFNISRYNISHDAPENFNWRLLTDHYLEPGSDNFFGIEEHYYITGPFRHQRLRTGNKTIGYIYYSSFANEINDYDIDYTLNRMRYTDGLIIDVRNNGGGALKNVFQIIERLTDTKRYIYASRMKDGPAHDDFGELQEVYCDPGGQIQYLKPVVLLTNRNCYSATSFLAAAMKAYPNVTQVGDTTGGGAGAPHGGQLPNGWYYRFSVMRSGYPAGDTLYDFENGVPPDIYVNMIPDDELNGHDTMVDTAISILTENAK